jgi:uncharacterized repeat protein (TIGR04138 family)
VNDQVSVDDLLGRIRAIEPRYSEPAYLLVLAALESCQQSRSNRGHISGQELAWACRDFAQRQYGLMARTVLAHWGIDGTEDFGSIVFDLIEAGLLVRNDDDSIENFDSVFDFRGAFDQDYPWSGVSDLIQAENVIK